MHKNDAKQSPGKQRDYDKPFVFKISKELLLDNIKENDGLMDWGATSHIITEESKFTRFVNPQQYLFYEACRSGEQHGSQARRHRGDAAGPKGEERHSNTEEGLVHTISSSERPLSDS